MTAAYSLRAVDRVLDALRSRQGEPRQRSGGSWSARCPAHDDHKPSLSVRQIEGQVLLYCHAGCSTVDVVAALGLAMRDLFDHAKGVTYRYPGGRIVRRTPDKRFWQQGDTADRSLYRLDRVAEAVAAGRTMYVVEGEKDVHALEAVGAVATTAPQGADGWPTVDPTPLAGATVVIVADDDEPGRRHAGQVRNSLAALQPPAKVSVVKAAEGKDAADHVAAGHGVEQFVALELAPAPARPRLKTIKASEVVERRVIYAWEGRIPIGSATLMPGEEGIGKTAVGIRLMADLTTGTLPGEFLGTLRNVVMMAPEDALDSVVKPRLREAGADLDRVTFVISRLEGEDEDSVILPRDLDLLTEVVRQIDAAFVWVDSLVTVLPDDLKSISYKDVNKAMKAISSWADAQRVAVVAPWHLNKQSGGDTAIRMMDSRAFRTAVRSLLLVVEDPEAPEGAAQGMVALDKVNAGPRGVPALRYKIRSARYTVAERDGDKPASCAVADWLGPVVGDGRAIARAALTPRIERPASAREWLTGYLAAHGEVLRTTVIEDGGKAGHKKTAVTDAAATIPVHSRDETGRQDGVPYRRSYWSLSPRARSSSSSPPSLDSRSNRSTRTTGETSGRTSRLVFPGQVQESGWSGSSVDGGNQTTGPDYLLARRSALIGKSREQIEAEGRALFEMYAPEI